MQPVRCTAVASNRISHAGQHCTSNGARYLLAQCCVALGRLAEAEEALTRPARPLRGQQPQPQATPGGAAGLYLLGKINRHALGVTGMLWVSQRAEEFTFDGLHWSMQG